MPTESELRALLRGDGEGGDRLDADRIIRLARARRRPKRVALGALTGLATAAVVVPVAIGVGMPPPMSASDDAGAALAPESAKDQRESDAVAGEEGSSALFVTQEPCGAEVVAAPSTVVSLAPITAASSTAFAPTAITIAADFVPEEAAQLTLASVVLVRDGVVAGYGSLDAVPLSAGETTVPAELAVLACPLDDPEREARLAAGTYQLVVTWGSLVTAESGRNQDVQGVVGELTIR